MFFLAFALPRCRFVQGHKVRRLARCIGEKVGSCSSRSFGNLTLSARSPVETSVVLDCVLNLAYAAGSKFAFFLFS